jgi:eukaryotic-like serine/threonine-protein kinase
MQMRFQIVLAAAVLAAFTARADWPMFRGTPDLAGVAPGSLPAEPKLLWTFKTQGPVKSTAAIADGKVFVGSNDRHLYALELATGKLVWAFTNSEAIESAPLVLNGKVYFGANDAHVYAVEAATGKLVWKFETGDKVISAPNWFVDGPRTNLLVGSYDFNLYCLDAETGGSNWVYATGNYINGSPVVADGLTTFGGCDGVLYSIALTNGQLVGSNDIGAPIAASVAVAGGRAFLGHYENRFLAVDLAANTTVWSYRDRAFPYFSAPAITADRV